MPYYTYINKKTKELADVDRGLETIAEMEAFLKKNKHLDIAPPTKPPVMVDAFKLGRIKPSENFRDVLREIKKKTPKNTINVM